MPATTVLEYHVSGPIIPMCNIGLSSALVNLGVCEEGADINLQQAVHDVKHDGAGGQDGFEAENILLNVAANITFSLVPHADEYVNILRAYSQASIDGVDTATDGIMPMPGTLFGTSGLFVTLYLPSILDPGGPWTFIDCRVLRAGNVRVSTKETKPQFEFRCINFVNPPIATTINNQQLYKRASP